MTLRQFAPIFASLAIQLRQTDADEATIRVYFEALKDQQYEFVAMAAERLAKKSAWFPKTSEWRATIVTIEAERREAQRALLRKLPMPLCVTCADTGWARDADDRVRLCDCAEQRRLEVLGKRPWPALPARLRRDGRDASLTREESAAILVQHGVNV